MHPADPRSRPATEDGSRKRRRAAWVAFALIASAIAVSDQLLKAWVVAHYNLDEKSPIVGDWLRVDFIHNSGGLFGMLQGLAPVLALVTVAVVAVLVALEAVSGWRSWLVTLTLSLLLGGAIGNFVDRIRLGYVIDFADIGIGTWRFPYIFNIADSAVTISILLMLALWLVTPWLERRDGAEPKESESLDEVASSGTGNGPAVG
jgi:signal peptidase II